MRSRTWAVALLLLGSGFCALVYQVSWLREFRLIFGASTAASAAVLAIFIGGLGLGGWLLGPRADAHRRPLLFYAQLEAIVAVSAAISPFLLHLARISYFALGGTTTLGLAFGTVGRLILSALVLAVPTIAMGGTLPAAARAATRTIDDRRQDLAALYALNTLGAVAGCVVSTFMLLEIYGTRTTLWLAALVNLLVAVTARALDRHWAGETGPIVPTGDSAPPFPALSGLPALPAPPAPSALPAFVLAASAIVGFAFFLMELVWYRMLGPLLGGSVFTFGLILAVALAGIGLGGLIYALTSRDRPATLEGFATTCLLESLAIAATFALGDRLAFLTMVLVPLRAGGFAASVFGWTVVTAIVVLPAALISGYQFPMLIALLGRARDRIGRQIGQTYAANTIGAILGSLAGGFGLLPWLSAPGAWRLVSVVLLLLGAAAVVRTARHAGWPKLAPHAAVAVVVILCVSAIGPTAAWRHSGIGAGRAVEGALVGANALRNWQNTNRLAMNWDGDGVESSIALMNDSSGYSFFVNGKSDGSARGDAGTQVMLGLLGALRNPAAKRALVVGLGTGSSAGWLAAVPSIERVDVVELEPLVIEVARAASSVNHDAMRNPKMHLIVGDARETLLTTREQYDVIASEPSNPFRAGIASLFTVEFYSAAHARLSDQGVIAQWVQGYEIDARTLRSIYTTLSTVFPYVEAWQTRRGDLVLIGAKRPPPVSASELTARIKEEPFRSAIAHVWRADTLAGVLAHFVAGDPVARALASGNRPPINTDDRNTVEFGFARSVGVTSGTMPFELRRLGTLMRASRMPLTDDVGINWDAVDTARVAYNAIQGYFDDLPSNPPANEQARQTAYLHYFQMNSTGAARASWERQSESARDLLDARLLASVEAESGSEAAMPWIERIRAFEPPEADSLVARLRYHQGRPDEAVSALQAALVGFRSDPWSTQGAMLASLNLVGQIATRHLSAAGPLLDALSEPFAVNALNVPRLAQAAELTRNANFGVRCVAPIGQFEPNPLWNYGFLTLRRDCYRAANDPRLEIAQNDLEEFLRREPASLIGSQPAPQ
jgi:spermidine synthase